MVRFVPFNPGHLKAFELQAPQFGELGKALERPEVAAALTNQGLALTALIEDRVIGCGGLLLQIPTCAYAWALVGRDVPPQAWVAVTRRVRDAIASAHRAGVVRIEAHADAGYGAACRWLELLGFEREGISRKKSPTLRDMIAYAHIEECA